MKKYFVKEKQEKNGKQVMFGKWSEGFSNNKNDKPDKKNKPKKTDDVEFEDDTVMMVDETAEVQSIVGKVRLFAINGGSLTVGGKKLV